MTVKQTPWVFRPSPLRIDSIVFFRCLAYGRADASVVDAELPMAPHRNPEELCDPWKIAGVFVFREIFLSKAFFFGFGRFLTKFRKYRWDSRRNPREKDVGSSRTVPKTELCRPHLNRLVMDYRVPRLKGDGFGVMFCFFLNNHGCYS